MSPILQALISTLFTYGLTIGGAAIVFCVDTARHQGTIMATASGLMLAAVTELLSSCLQESESYGMLSWIPMAVGFCIASISLWGLDVYLRRSSDVPIEPHPHTAGDLKYFPANTETPTSVVKPMAEQISWYDDTLHESPNSPRNPQIQVNETHPYNKTTTKTLPEQYEDDQFHGCDVSASFSSTVEHVHVPVTSSMHAPTTNDPDDQHCSYSYSQNHQVSPSVTHVSQLNNPRRRSSIDAGETSLLNTDKHVQEPNAADLRKARMLVFALAVQHIPEALACGVAFAAAAQALLDGDEHGETFGAAVSLTIAIGLQDIPEGMAAAFVLRNLGWSKSKSFWYGQLTGIVQPISGIIGAAAVLLVKTILPYALGFAGAAMLFVIIKDMIPDIFVDTSRRMKYTLLVMLSFVVMTAASVTMDQIQIIV